MVTASRKLMRGGKKYAVKKGDNQHGSKLPMKKKEGPENSADGGAPHVDRSAHLSPICKTSPRQCENHEGNGTDRRKNADLEARKTKVVAV